ncbi:hypothetical protein Tco_1102436 [Tanacetum coccineum]
MKLGALEENSSVFNQTQQTDLLHPGPGRRRRVVCSIGAHRLGKLADIRRVKTVREVTGSPNQEDTGEGKTEREGTMIIEAEVEMEALRNRIYSGRRCILDVSLRNCFIRLRPRSKKPDDPSLQYSRIKVEKKPIWPIAKFPYCNKDMCRGSFHFRRWMNFMVIRSHQNTMGGLKQTGLRKIRVPDHPRHRMLKSGKRRNQ